MDSENCHILLIEDSSADLMLVEEALAECSIPCSINLMTDGHLAFEHISQLREVAAAPALIILDMNLPKRSGVEVLSAIRANPLLSGIPVLVLSASNHAADRTRALDAGAHVYMQKPASYLEFQEVGKVIRSLLVARVSVTSASARPVLDFPI